MMAIASENAADSPPRIGRLPSGARDAITDVPGVTVGHATHDDGEVQTGVTVVHPHGLDPYQHKVPAGVAVINGFGKSVGLVQLEELGQLETPIALTNTFSVSAMSQAQIRQCIERNPETGRGLPTVNPLVLECNDGYLNDIQRMVLAEADYRHACAAAYVDVAQGAVGAGRGMSSFELKGGVGTASRRAALRNGETYMVGALVLSNYGVLSHLVWGGDAIGSDLAALLDEETCEQARAAEKGSIIMLVATDAPLDARQLKRLALRAAAGLARTGSVYGHGSGDIALAFSTAYAIPHLAEQPMPTVAMVHEALMDGLFLAAADAVEQAIVHAMWFAEPVQGRNGHRRAGIRELLSRRRGSAVASSPVGL